MQNPCRHCGRDRRCPGKKGDADAQVYVGEIYEKGIQSGPDYALAAQWYAKAAATGSASAENHLAFLYEKGLGVHQDGLRAVNLYREAAGIRSDHLIFASELTTREAQLNARLQESTEALSGLAKQLEQTCSQLQSQQQSTATAERTAAALRARLTVLEQRNASAAQTAALRHDLAEAQQRLEEQHKALASLEQSVIQTGVHLGERLADVQRQGTRIKARLDPTQTQALSAQVQLAALQARLSTLEQAVSFARDEARRKEQTLHDAPRTPGASREALIVQREQAVAHSLEEERAVLARQVVPCRAMDSRGTSPAWTMAPGTTS